MSGNGLGRSMSSTRSMSISSGGGKAFGGVTYMNKEEHDRERIRWINKMEEVELRLAESETLNSDMNQIKAELNKKIVELERNQRPLIEQNRKLNERNKNITQELKRLESKVAHQMDDFLTLKDSHDRVVKENALLKRERTFPEKLEELDRYRNQVLEYSKCITALRQAGLEKDRRYEVLVMKLKRLRRVARGGDEDRQSIVGSDYSGDSSISLDTITEDLEETVSKELQSSYEALYRENEDLARTLHAMGGDQTTLREQLAFARATIAQQQLIIDSTVLQIEAANQQKVTIDKQENRIQELDEEVERLQHELAATEEQRELLEFQVIEMRECGSDHVREASSSSEDVEEIEYPLQKLTYQEICDMKADMRGMRRASNLQAEQRRSIAKAYAYLEQLEGQWIEHESTCPGRGRTDLNGNSQQLLEEVCDLSKELGLVRYQLQTTEEELKAERAKADALNSRISSLEEENRDVEIAQLEERMREQMTELDALRGTLNENKKKLQMSESERIKLQGDFNVLSAECERLKNDLRPSIKTELERRFEETRYRLTEALNKIEKYENVIDAAKRVDSNRSSYAEELQKELEECKEYNQHMERQFRTQTDIIDALKTKLISCKNAMDFLNTLPTLSPDFVHKALVEFAKNSRDEGAKKMISLIAEVIEHCTVEEDRIVCDPLKLRECRSMDSGGDSLSNGSVSSSIGRHSDDEEWHSNRSGSDLRA